MSHSAPAYGLWSLVIVNSAIFIFFAYTFFEPQTLRDWRSFSAFSAFLVALFAEMYGFPVQSGQMMQFGQMGSGPMQPAR